ncbi:hypothetical protein GCM10023339_41460 [Alloalcanivorax gelatiniphagus]
MSQDQPTEPAESLGRKAAAISIGSDDKLARIRESLASTQAAIDASGVGRLADLMADHQERIAQLVTPKIDFPESATPTFDTIDLTSKYAETSRLIDQIDWSNTPEARAAKAGEKTAELLEALVESAVESDTRAADAERRAVEAEDRENRMLELTIANTRISKVAAISGVIGVLVGIVAIVVTVALG